MATLSFNALKNKLHLLHIKPTAVRIPHNIVARECKITQIIHAVDVGFKLWRYIKNAYTSVDIAIFKLQPIQKKASLMKVFITVITLAIQKCPIDCTMQNLKDFVSTSYKF